VGLPLPRISRVSICCRFFARIFFFLSPPPKLEWLGSPLFRFRVQSPITSFPRHESSQLPRPRSFFRNHQWKNLSPTSSEPCFEGLSNPLCRGEGSCAGAPTPPIQPPSLYSHCAKARVCAFTSETLFFLLRAGACLWGVWGLFSCFFFLFFFFFFVWGVWVGLLLALRSQYLFDIS